MSDASQQQRVRILWLSHLLPWPPKGGLRQRSFHLMKAVGERHDLSVVAFRQSAQQPEDGAVSEALAELSKFASIQAVIDLPQGSYPMGQTGLALRSLLPGPPFTLRWGQSRAFQAAVDQAIASLDPQVMHVDTISLAPYAKAYPEIPACLNHHNIESDMLLRRADQERNPLKRAYFRQEGQRLQGAETALADRFSRHLVCADLDGERLNAMAPNAETSVVPNGVDLDYFTPANPPVDEVPDSLIFVGGLSWYPNASAMTYFIRDIWPGLRAVRPAATLTVVGRNASASLRRLGETHAGVRFTGFVDDMRPLVHRSQVYVCPIFDGGGTKLKMLDAMALGKAIVAHPVACEGLGLTDGEDVLLADTPDAFRDQIIRLFDDEVLRNRLGLAARRRAETVFSFVEIGARLADLYEELASAGSGRASGAAS